MMVSNSKKVYVLMSVYNGGAFLEQQINSILNQTHSNVSIIIRDDGSTDQLTACVLDKFKMHPNIKIFFEDNVGLPNAFFGLLSLAPSTGDYYFFSDQDDVWMPEKIEKAIQGIDQLSGKYRLYLSRALLVDENLNEIGLSKVLPESPTYQQAVVTNLATGCTLCFDRNFFLLVSNNLPEMSEVYLHDWWFYLVGAFLGSVYVDSGSYIYYRQHGNNTVGMKKGKLQRTIARVLRVLTSDAKFTGIERQVAEFNRLYVSLLSSEQRQFVDAFLMRNHGFFNRVKYLFSRNVMANSTVDLFLIKILLFLGVIR